jgi:hypothetical protein
MQASRSRHAVPALGLLLFAGNCGAADGDVWWQRIEGYAALGLAQVKAEPDTGGVITLSFNDSGTAGTDISFTAGSGRNSNDYLPVLQLGGRVNVVDALTVGLTGQFYSFSDGLSAVPLLTPGTTPLATFGTYRETSLFKLDARDIAATAGYSRWGVTAEAVAGWRSGDFETRSEVEAFGVITTGHFANVALSNGASFAGDGPLFGLRLDYRLPSLPVRVVARYSYSKLDGQSDSFGRAVGTVASSPSAPLVGAATVTRNNAEAKMIVQDMEFGAQYEFELGGRSSFLRASWMRAKWAIDGLPTGGAGFGGTIGTLTTNSFSSASADRSDGLLSGGMLTVGLEF